VAIVPRPTVPPGAGNEAKKAVKPEPKRVEKGAQGYVERSRFDGHLDATTVRRHDDGDSAAVLTIQIEQRGLRRRFSATVRPRCSGSLAGIVHASTAPDGTSRRAAARFLRSCQAHPSRATPKCFRSCGTIVRSLLDAPGRLRHPGSRRSAYSCPTKLETGLF